MTATNEAATRAAEETSSYLEQRSASRQQSLLNFVAVRVMPFEPCPGAAFVPTLYCPAEHIIKFQSLHLASEKGVQQAALTSALSVLATETADFLRSKNFLSTAQPAPTS